MFSRRIVVGLVLFPTLNALHARGQTQSSTELGQVRQEMEQLKQEYEQQRLDYEQRLKKLDEQLKRMETSSTTPAPASVATVASVPATSQGPSSQDSQNSPDQNPFLSPVRSGQSENPFKQDTESIQLALNEEEKRRVRERMEHVLRGYVDISGYFRAGYGRDNEGGPQVAFQAPGAMAKGRLGNEAENYGEITIGKNFYLPGAFSLKRGSSGGGISSEPVGRVQVRLSMYNPYSNYLVSSATQFGLAEAWAAIGNLNASQPSMSFWAGNRFYRRHDIHIDDFFLYNMSGGGGGVEDIKTPLGKIAFAWIGLGSQSAFSDIPQPDPLNKAGFNKTNFDFRLYDFKLIGGTGEFGFDVSHASSGKDQNGVQAPNVSGVSFTFIHTTEKWAGENNLNKFYIQYGRGPARTFTSGFETFSTSTGTYIRPDAPDSYRFRVADNLIFQTGNHFSISPMVLYQATDYKQYGGIQHWFSIGARPQVNFTNYFNVAVEPFLDWVDDKSTNVSDSLFKVTIAPQIVAGRGFMSRPAIRAFLTYAHWGNGFVGKVGGLDYTTANEGLTWGLQMESWW
jgi:maltoporin